MTKERISSAELALRKEEYYELLATSDSALRDVLNQRGGLVLARVGRYQPWPARFSEPGEFAKMARYRAKKGQACVYFFGSRNYGWVSKSSIQSFPEDLTTLTGSNKYNQALIQEALDEAKFVMDVTDEIGKRFFDRIMERKEEAVDLPCERCNRVDDHYSLLILCDGKNWEKELCDDGEKTTSNLKHPSPRKVNVKNVLWKCNQCPLAITEEALPELPQGQIFSKKSRTFMCPNCYLNAPAKVQLAKRLEKIWSTLATNRQGTPLCGPLLCGVDPVDGQSEDTRTQLDLFKILAKIRRLDYEESAAFSRDIDEVVANALDLIANRSYPLMEAAKTLKIIRNEQFAIHQQKLNFLDGKIRRLHTDRENGRDDDDNDLVDAETKWPLRWRQECGPFEDKYYARLDAKSLEEWTALVSAAPLYASGDEFDGRSGIGSYMSDELSEGEDASPQNLGSVRSRSPSLGSVNELSGPPAATRVGSGLSLSEGMDVMIAFDDLSKPGSGNQKRRFGGDQTKELDNMDAREFFLSPSTSEMQHMFDQQSTLLRSALEAHSTLQRSWLISQQDMLGLGGRGGFSVGEGRLAAELRLANKNLRQRLRNKDKLVDQLTSDHMALRAEVINLQRELSQSKIRARELEERVATAGEGSVVNSKAVVSNGETAATPDRSTDEEHMFQ
ncbi:phd zinc finger (c3hc4 type) family protein [Phytophthora cinnamomi]|uniref:phd zinc finger (c3hc4 type) family protein n=1 Tax=Phytophthora cinnamomi TaxID=4785 RepID=UPI0035596EB1|nr:phd zinc finger (c3hc4 type) family protein [Phytophthora cinnamomi]